MKYNLNKDWAKISNGDLKSFELLYHKYYRRLCLYAFSLLSDEYEAEEIVQDIYVNLWKNRKSIQITGSLKSYLFRAVHNQSVNAIKRKLTKKNSVNNTLPGDSWIGLENMINYDAYILERLEAEDTEKKITEAIEMLPDQCKKIFKLSRLDNLSTTEISQKLNISTHTVRGQIQKAIQKILKYI